MSSKEFNILVNKFSLTFRDSKTEEDFRSEAIDKIKTTIRIAASIGMLVFIFVAIFNPPDVNSPEFLINRFLIPLTALGLIGITFLKRYHNVYLISILLIYIVGTTSSIYTALLNPDLNIIIYLRIVFFTLIPFITFRALIFSNIFLFTSTIFMSLYIHVDDVDLAIKRGLLLIPFFVISIMAFYVKQRFERINYINNRDLVDKNNLLEFDKKRLENQGVLSVILQDSTDTTLNIEEFLKDALDVILYLPWLKLLAKGSIYVTNNEGNLEMIASNNLGSLKEVCKLVKPGQCLCGKALVQKELLFNNCVTDDHEIQIEGIEPHGHYNVPLMLDDKNVLGVLNIYVKHGHVDTDEEREFLLLVSDTLASVIYRTNLQKEKEKQAVLLNLAHSKVTSSIEYAKRIQQSLLPDINILNERFIDVLLTFKPKEVVSGDFYLINTIDNITYVTVADCTGHGVPGAIVSTLGIQQLSYLIENKVLNVGEKLDALNNKISKSLNNDNQIGSDGMDLVLIAINKELKTIDYSGAKGLFYIHHNGEMMNLKTDRLSIGQNSNDNDFKFTNKTFNYTEGDTVFLLTDGLIDQLSIENSKRVGSKRTKVMLEATINMSSSEKDEHLNKFFNKHISENQTDDITLISFKL